MSDRLNDQRTSLLWNTFGALATEEISSSTPQPAAHNYDNINVQDSNAFFGSIDNSTHYHYHLPVGAQSSDTLSRKRRRGSENNEDTLTREEGRGNPLERLIESLSFDNIWQRHGDVVSAHRGTCEWLLSEDQVSLTTWAGSHSNTEERLAFSRWLESNDDYFWICGVAGSGKSTLVNYIVQHESELKARLSAWADKREIIFASFFFWRHGCPLQRNINGMLRALLIQLLQQDPNIIKSIIGSSHYQYQQAWRRDGHARGNRPWSQSELKLLLHKAIQCSQNRIFFLIDALDEFHGYDVHTDPNPHEAALRENIDSLLENIRELWEMPNVKVCVASRPGNIFDSTFVTSRTLDLERLNNTDISVYANARLSYYASSDVSAKLTNRVMYRSGVIFLWAKLAVDSLVNGMVDGDTPEDLERRLDDIPAGLESMYRHMLQRLAPRDRDDAKMIFSLHNRLSHYYLPLAVPNALPIFLCRNSHLLGYSDEVHNLTPIYMAKILNSRSCGLLELRSRDFSALSRAVRTWGPAPRFREMADALDIRFIHRTAQEYVRKNVVNCNSQQDSAGATMNDHPTDYCLSIIEGSIHYLEMLHTSYYDGMHDEKFMDEKFDRTNAPAYSPQVYELCLTLLSNLRHAGNHAAAERYLNRLARIPLMRVNSDLFVRCGIIEHQAAARFAERLHWLSHVSHFSYYGFEEYALARIGLLDTDKPVAIAYLLYFALRWFWKGQLNISRQRYWIEHLQTMLNDHPQGCIYIEAIWIHILVQRSRCKLGRISLEKYKMLLDVFKSISLPPQKRHCLYLGKRQPFSLLYGGFSYHQKVWQVAISSAVLLDPRVLSVDDCAFSMRIPSNHRKLGSLHLFEESLPPMYWPRTLYVTQYHDSWLQLDFPLDLQQSEWINQGRPTPNQIGRSQVSQFNLKWTMLYELAQKSGTLSPEVTWVVFVRRTKSIFDHEQHMRQVSRGRGICTQDSCMMCKSPDPTSMAVVISHKEEHDLLCAEQFRACSRNTCWDCSCIQNGCSAPQTNCKCSVEVKSRLPVLFEDPELCHADCRGCSCVRKIYTIWLREVLLEDELDWDRWYDALIDKYSLREKSLLEVWEEQLDAGDAN